MNRSFYQIILGLISLTFIVGGFFKLVRREKSQSFFKFFATMFVWGTIFSFALFPRLSHTVSEKIGLGENLNTLIFIGFVVMFIILFKIINILERTERNISEIVRKEALSKLNEK